jgi:amino acid transporter
MQNEGRGLLTLTAVFAVAMFVIVVGLFTLVAIIGGGNPLLVLGDECDRADCGAGPVIGLAAVVAFLCFCSGFVAAYFRMSRRD